MPILEQVREVTISVRRTNNWSARLSEEFPASTEVIDCRPSSNGDGMQQLIEIIARPEVFHKVLNFIKSDKDIRHANIAKTKRGRIFGVITTANSNGYCKTVTDTNCFCLTCPMVAAAKPDGTVDWRLTMTTDCSLDNLVEELHRNGAEPTVVKISSVLDVDSLTVYQHRIIERAFLAGFFEYPRRSGLDELSEHIGISSSSLSETIRRAERKIISRYLRYSANPAALAAAYDRVRSAK